MTVEERGELNHTVYLQSLLRRIARQRMARARRQAEAQAREEDRQEGEARGMLLAALNIAKKLLPSHEVEQLKALPPEQALEALTQRLQAR